MKKDYAVILKVETNNENELFTVSFLIPHIKVVFLSKFDIKRS